MLSCKSFATSVVAEMQANPRKYLAGHGIGGIMFKKICRSDILYKLGCTLFKLKTSKRGANGLKKSKLFAVKAYKNIAELRKNGFRDIDAFHAGLVGEDAANFSNANNIICYVAVDRKKLVAGPEGDDVEMGIVTDASYTIPFEDAINKNWRLPGAWYVVVMFADSLILPREDMAAKRREKREKAKARRERKNAAKVKQKLAKMTKLAKIIEVKINDVDSEIVATNNQIAQLQRARQQQQAMRNSKSFDVAKYKRLEVIRKKKSALKKKIQQLQLDLSLAPANKVRSIKSMISTYKRKYEAIKAEESRVKGYGVTDKSALITELRKKTEKLMARGESLRSALNKATASISQLTPQQKQQVRQQIAMQVADGVPPVFAQQAAIQQLDLTAPTQNQYAQNVSAQDIIDALDDYSVQNTVDDVDDIDDVIDDTDDDDFNLQELIASL